jgi:hypothetical protein
MPSYAGAAFWHIVCTASSNCSCGGAPDDRRQQTALHGGHGQSQRSRKKAGVSAEPLLAAAKDDLRARRPGARGRPQP